MNKDIQNAMDTIVAEACKRVGKEFNNLDVQKIEDLLERIENIFEEEVKAKT